MVCTVPNGAAEWRFLTGGFRSTAAGMEISFHFLTNHFKEENNGKQTAKRQAHRELSR